MAYYSIYGISQFLLNNEKQMVRFLLACPITIYLKSLETSMCILGNENVPKLHVPKHRDTELDVVSKWIFCAEYDMFRIFV